MTIECYESDCKFHSCHDHDEGPFCYEGTCHYQRARLVWRWTDNPVSYGLDFTPTYQRSSNGIAAKVEYDKGSDLFWIGFKSYQDAYRASRLEVDKIVDRV